MLLIIELTNFLVYGLAGLFLANHVSLPETVTNPALLCSAVLIIISCCTNAVLYFKEYYKVQSDLDYFLNSLLSLVLGAFGIIAVALCCFCVFVVGYIIYFLVQLFVFGIGFIVFILIALILIALFGGGDY